ncbi:hypothetical protein BY996DRAFT_6783662 [Phakopsora pachyrhizi]|nr:hypothetical protein BY996DRAFT_6783662 [Phakopsora pachyrhizi]
MFDTRFAFRSLGPKERKHVFERLLNHFASNNFPTNSVTGDINLKAMIENFEVTEADSLLENIYSDATNLHATELTNVSGHALTVFSDCFFRHQYIYHSLKLHLKYADGLDSQKLQNVVNFSEENLKVIIAKIDLIKSMIPSDIQFGPGWNGPLLSPVTEIDYYISPYKYVQQVLNMEAVKNVLVEKYSDEDILMILDSWIEELTVALKAFEEQENKYKDFLIINEKSEKSSNDLRMWKNNVFVKRIHKEFEEILKPEEKVFEMINFLKNWANETKQGLKNYAHVSQVV